MPCHAGKTSFLPGTNVFEHLSTVEFVQIGNIRLSIEVALIPEPSRMAENSLLRSNFGYFHV
jgi:hypothetical protein